MNKEISNKYKINRLFKSFLNIFKRTKIKFVGRGGIIFIDDENKYSIDSEFLFSKDYDIVVYSSNHYLIKDNEKIELNKEQCKEIVKKVINELEKVGLRVDY